MSRVGFIGLGNMGGPMARNLVKQGHQVAGFDVSPTALDRFAASGGQAADSISAAASNAEFVISVLPSITEVDAVYRGPNGVIAAARPGTTFIDCSTIEIDRARSLIGDAVESGFDMVEAPISGGFDGATAGTLTFMVGGTDAAFARVGPVLEAMGTTVVHMGPAGCGQATKLCNNLIAITSMVAVCEAFALAEKLDLDARKLFEISSKSTGRCWAMLARCPVPGVLPDAPASHNFDGGGAARLAVKDLQLIQKTALFAGSPAPLCSTAMSMYQLMANNGYGDKDFSAMFMFLKGVAAESLSDEGG